MYKEKIINETLRLFLIQGVELKLSDIATNIGISKKTIYRYFHSKEELLLETVDNLFLNIHKEQDLIFNDESIDDVTRLKKLMIAMPRNMTSVDLNLLVELNKQYPKVYQRVNHYLESDWDQTFELIDKCKSKGLIKNIDNNIFRAMFLGSEEKIIELSSLGKDYEEVQNEMIDILIGGIKNA